ncbi:hypothetical protein [Peribacillus huizhouensis]|uniref:Lipoprotein n=1 Tax=Peribacillus huizhouensis TaxID=1501239 RepID=A0ABR6CTH1_9BACI|nr:hypothetical protein [Peribacillus huizhouensis]MBA9027642.1 hypothetical protein [Peribacillus huizhouensis]
MKKFTSSIIFLVTIVCILSGCFKPTDKDLASVKGTYSIYSVGDYEVDVKLEEDLGLVNYIHSITLEKDYEYAKEVVPYLKIDKSKYNYFVFDSKGLIYETTDYGKLLRFLKDNPNPK